jgi:hypothetical protein
MPLTGIYALGIEPWTARHDLERAVADGEAIELAGSARFHTALQANFSPGPWPESTEA